MSNPAEIQAQIEQTRAGLSADVDALGEKVSPSRIVERRVGHAKTAVSSLRDRVMGSSSTAAEHSTNALRSATDSVQSAASNLSDTASSAPAALRRQIEGNPLAAGVIAFGVGMLVSSLLPASAAEQHVAEQVKDTATDVGQPLVEQAQGAVKEFASNLQQPVQDAAEQVKSAASDAASSTAEHARSAASDVKDQAQQAAH